MTYMLRDRPDGQFEIVLTRSMLVGIFPEKQTASKVMFFLREEEIDLVEDAPATFGQASRDTAEAVDSVLDTIDMADHAKPAPIRPPVPAQIKRTPPAAPIKAALTDEQAEVAFGRISAGEKLGVVAPEFGLTMNQLRGLWANHCRKLQQHLTTGGKVVCRMCGKDFMPSLSHPDTCARCSHE